MEPRDEAQATGHVVVKNGAGETQLSLDKDEYDIVFYTCWNAGSRSIRAVHSRSAYGGYGFQRGEYELLG